MKLTWYGTAALVLEESGAVIAFDPFAGIPLGQAHPERPPVRYADAFRRAGNVFVTHGHFDHILQIPALYADTPATIHATVTPCRKLWTQGLSKRQLHRIAPDQTISVEPFTLHTWQGRHCQFDLPLIGKTVFRPDLWRHLPHMLRLLRWNQQYKENGEILFYEVSCGDKRIQIMGSMGLDDTVTYPVGADALVLPYQGRSDLIPYGLALVQRLQPQRILLDHYDDRFPPMTMQVETADFETLLTEQYGIPCQALHVRETYII